MYEAVRCPVWGLWPLARAGRASTCWHCSQMFDSRTAISWSINPAMTANTPNMLARAYPLPMSPNVLVMVKAIHIIFEVDHIQDNSEHGLNGEKLNKAHKRVQSSRFLVQNQPRTCISGFACKTWDLFGTVPTMVADVQFCKDLVWKAETRLNTSMHICIHRVTVIHSMTRRVL